MYYHKQSPLVLTIALVIFGVASLLPLVYMLGGFLVHICSEPTVFSSILLDSRQLILLGRSIGVAMLSSLIAFSIGSPVALCLSAKGIPFQKNLFFLSIIPLIIPGYVMAGAWIHLLAPGSFAMNLLESSLNIKISSPLHSVFGCSWCLGITYFPVYALIVSSGIKNIDRSLIEYNKLLPKSLKVFYHTYLIQILPHIIASFCLVMIFVLGRYSVPSLLGINTYPVEIFSQFSAFYDENRAIGTSIPLIFVVFILIIIQKQVMSGRKYITITPKSDTGNVSHRFKYRYLAVLFVLLIFAITVILPFCSVIVSVGSLSKFLSIIQSSSDSIINTTLIAIIAAIVSTMIAIPIGHKLAYGKGKLHFLLDIACWLPLAVPGTIAGLGFIKITEWAPYLRNNDSFGIILVICYIGMFAVLSVRVIELTYKQNDPNIEELSSFYCKKWYQRFIYLDIPLHSVSFLASVIIVFIFASGELNATVLLVPPGKPMLSVTIDNLLHYGANTKASVLCITEALLVIGFMVIGIVLSNIIKYYQKS